MSGGICDANLLLVSTASRTGCKAEMPCKGRYQDPATALREPDAHQCAGEAHPGRRHAYTLGQSRLIGVAWRMSARTHTSKQGGNTREQQGRRKARQRGPVRSMRGATNAQPLALRIVAADEELGVSLVENSETRL